MVNARWRFRLGFVLLVFVIAAVLLRCSSNQQGDAESNGFSRSAADAFMAAPRLALQPRAASRRCPNLFYVTLFSGKNVSD
jgi:hypothetical protein